MIWFLIVFAQGLGYHISNELSFIFGYKHFF